MSQVKLLVELLNVEVEVFEKWFILELAGRPFTHEIFENLEAWLIKGIVPAIVKET
jgi:hypothetical protein